MIMAMDSLAAILGEVVTGRVPDHKWRMSCPLVVASRLAAGSWGSEGVRRLRKSFLVTRPLERVFESGMGTMIEIGGYQAGEKACQVLQPRIRLENDLTP
jgi:hypothetical protein